MAYRVSGKQPAIVDVWTLRQDSRDAAISASKEIVRKSAESRGGRMRNAGARPDSHEKWLFRSEADGSGDGFCGVARTLFLENDLPTPKLVMEQLGINSDECLKVAVFPIESDEQFLALTEGLI